MKIVYFFSVVLCFFMIGSCAPKKKSGEESLPEGGGTDEVVVISPENESGPSSPGNERPGRFKLEKKVEEREKIILDKDKTALGYQFLTVKTGSLIPADFKIGLLQDYDGETKDEIEIIDNLVSFCDGLKKKNIKTSLLHQENETGIFSFLDHGLKSGYIPADYRIGRINQFETGEARVNLRLIGVNGRSEGEIYLKKESGKWLIADIQINMDGLGQEYEVGDELFSPSSYHWILQEK